MKTTGFSRTHWFTGWHSIAGTDRLAMMPDPTDRPIGHFFEHIGSMGYWLEVSRVTSGYRVRAFPVPGTIQRHNPAITLSYRGEDIERIIQTISHELALLARTDEQPGHTTVEVVRWVP